MPNHVANEVIFRNLSADLKAEILANTVGADGRIDFEVLIPSPLNIWLGSVSEKHEKTFPDTHLDWARKNWGTKWNAYGANPAVEETADALILRFDTAWRPPYGWLVAIFNRFKVSFEHNWLSEGGSQGVCGKFNYARLCDWGSGEAWSEEPATGEMQKHLHVLRWGCESFDDENAA